jgi:hypothetical protein
MRRQSNEVGELTRRGDLDSHLECWMSFNGVLHVSTIAECVPEEAEPLLQFLSLSRARRASGRVIADTQCGALRVKESWERLTSATEMLPRTDARNEGIAGQT